jgi:hypothetical protein
MSAVRVISETSLRFLLESGSPINLQNGFRTISRQSISSYDSDDTIDIPDILNSSESLQFCGMQKEVADSLYQRWLEEQQNLQPGNFGYGDFVIEFAEVYVKDMARVEDALWEGDDWEKALKKQGMKESVRRGILDPHFNNLRLSRSASEWALDTLDIGWTYLTGLDTSLKKDAGSKKSKMAVDIRSVSPDPSVRPSKATKSSTSLTGALHSEDPRLKLAIETDVPKDVPGRTLLHKGGNLERLRSIFHSDGSLNMTEILSTPPVDFHPSHSDLYFSKQWDVALHYAGYVRSRNGTASAIMTVAVPSNLLSESREVFGADWKKLVWSSRNKTVRMRNGGRLPKDLVEYESADVLIGNICGIGNNQVSRLQSSDDIPVLMTPSGAKGSQVVFQGPDMLTKFETECRGYVWISPLNSTKAIHIPLPT